MPTRKWEMATHSLQPKINKVEVVYRSTDTKFYDVVCRIFVMHDKVHNIMYEISKNVNE